MAAPRCRAVQHYNHALCDERTACARDGLWCMERCVLVLCRGGITLPPAWSLASRPWPLDSAAAFASGQSAMDARCEPSMPPLSLAGFGSACECRVMVFGGCCEPCRRARRKCNPRSGGPNACCDRRPPNRGSLFVFGSGLWLRRAGLGEGRRADIGFGVDSARRLWA